MARPLLFALALAIPGIPADARAQQTPHWVWHPTPTEHVALRRAFSLPADAVEARLWATADNHVDVWLNGGFVLRGDVWEEVGSVALDQLSAGANTILVLAKNEGGPAAAAVRLWARLADGTEWELCTDGDWQCTDTPPDDPSTPADGSEWRAVAVLGAVGDPNLPWTAVEAADFARDPAAVQTQAPTPAEGIELLPGFAVERLYAVDRATQGSWVSLARGPAGTLVASDQRGKGLFRIQPATLGDPAALTTVQRLPIQLERAQGMVWAFDSLYAVVNGADSGLYRARDGDGDGELDTVEQLTALDGSGEHGPHGVVVTPDGEALMIACGNHTAVPTDAVRRSRIPMTWGEDLLLPRLWDARGHARGRLAPGGFICRVSPDGQDWEIHSVGYRNQYDLAFSADGELFTFDADMEWDMGMPWYRPTRICHVVSGSEFGWRAGSGKWPADSPDSLPAAVEIGPGSPTGVVFGTDAAFPAAYRRALFALDWTFGTVWAVHLEAHGGSYRGTAEPFATGAPLPVCDAVVGTDGALYLVTGGRGVASALYRVSWQGEAGAAPAASPPTPEAALRRSLERFHGVADAAAIDAAWPHLGHRDRHVRYAARLAVEAQPVSRWSARALDERDPARSAHALLALARFGDSPLLPGLLAAARRIDLAAADDIVQHAALRALALAAIRMGPLDEPTLNDLRAHLAGLPPPRGDSARALWVELRVYARDPAIVPVAVATLAPLRADAPPAWGALIERNDSYGAPIRRMLDAMPPVMQLQTALTLRVAREGWDPALRRQYFEFLAAAGDRPGGSSYQGFVQMIRNEALAECSETEREALAALLVGDGPPREPPAAIEWSGVRHDWTLENAAASVDGALRKRDFERGRALFFAAACAACHRFDGEGGSVGPDLTSAGNRFSTEDLLEAIIDPSAAISDQYESAIVFCTDGRAVFGRVVETEDGDVLVYPPVPMAPPVRIAEGEVDRIQPSPISQMPPDLLAPLDEEDLRDLVAYLLSRANADDGMFR